MRWKKKRVPKEKQYRIRRVLALVPTVVQDEVLFMERYYEVSIWVQPWSQNNPPYWKVLYRVSTLPGARQAMQDYHAGNHFGSPSVFEQPVVLC
jgi:hypothetical protein